MKTRPRAKPRSISIVGRLKCPFVTSPDPNRLPQQIYIRRRVAALAALVVLAALGVWAAVAFAGRGDDPQPDPAAASTEQSVEATATQEQPEGTASAEPNAESDTESSTEPSGTQTADRTEASSAAEATAANAALANKKTCELADLTITAATDKTSYGPDVQPKFYLTAANPTRGDCHIDLKEQQLRFEVYSMATNQRVWADTDCNESEGRGVLDIPAGQERHFEAVWSRTTSAPQACSGREPAAPGSYYLHAVIGSHPSPALPFNLS